MERTITIRGRTGLFDIPSFLFSKNENLLIHFDFKDEKRLRYFRVVVRHGDHRATYTLSKTEPIEISSKWLQLNAENLEFSLVMLNESKTAVIKSDYQIEPLKMESIDGNFRFSAMVQELTVKQQQLETAFAEIKERMVKAENKLKEFEDNGVPLLCE